MYISLIISFLWVITAVFPYPLKRSATATDIEVLAFANVLEQLESAFYTQALELFNASSFGAAGFASAQIPIQQIQTIASDENTHALTLQSAVLALGGQIVSNCTFNFSSAFTNVDTMVATARVIENVGVSAYLGALTSLTEPALVTAAASILTVEARHQTILNLLSNATSIPQPFDVALSPADVLAVADTFISGCKLGLSANPPLTVTNSGPLQAGTQLSFSSPALNGTTPSNQLSCEIVTGGSNASIYQPVDSCMVPANITGPMYVFITTDQTANKSPSNANGTTSSGRAVAGPALLFIDQPDFIGDLIRPGLDVPGATIGNGTTSLPTTASTLPSIAPAPSLQTGTTSALSAPTSTPVASTTPIPSSGSLTTTTISPGQASAILSSLAG